MFNFIRGSEAAKLLGGSTQTIRRWVNVGQIKSTRTEAGKRRFLVSDLLGSRQDASLTVADARVKRLVLTHKDRLLRFGSALILTLCEMFGTEVVIINRTESSTYESNLAQDV